MCFSIWCYRGRALGGCCFSAITAMALGLFLQASLMSFLLLISSGQTSKKVPVYRIPHDTSNLEVDIHSDWTKADDLSDDDSEPDDPSSYEPDASKSGPTEESNVSSHPLVTPNPTNAENLININKEDRKVQDADKPLTFPLNPYLKPQVASGDRVLFRPFPQSPSHPHNRHVSHSSFYPPSNAWYSWSPVVSNRFYSAGPQTYDFRRGDSTNPYFYNGNFFRYPLDNSYSGTLNRHGNYKHERSPTGYAVNTQTVNVPEGQGQSFSKRNYYAPVDYRPRPDQMHVSPVMSNQPSPQKERKLTIPRYIIQSRNGYQTIRYLASKTSYDPKV